MKCKKCRDYMAEAYYGELAGETLREFETHVRSCDDCAALFREIESTLGIMSERRRVDPGEQFWNGYYERLEARMGKTAAEPERTHTVWWKRRVLGGAGSRSSWAYRVAAAVVLIGIGVMADRMFLSPPDERDTPEQMATAPAVESGRGEKPDATGPGPGVEPTAEESRRRSAPVSRPPADVATTPESTTPDSQPPDGEAMQLASARAMRYVDKSQMLLLALVNTDPDDDGYAAGIETQRRRSKQLLAEAPSLREALDDPKQRRLRELVGELEKILREIANLDAEDDVEAVEVIRGSVNRHDVMLKINLEQMKYGSDERAATRDDA